MGRLGFIPLDNESRSDYAKVRRQKQLYLHKIKDVPCMDCGAQYPYYVMDFDHTSDNKVDNVGHMVATSWQKLKAEVAKCDIVCSNCHRERTHQRFLDTEVVDE